MIKCCIFDLDGTLLNTLETIRYYLNRTLALHSLPSMSSEECRAYVGNGARNLVFRTLAARGVTDPEFIDRFYDEYNEAYDAAPIYLTEPYEGIIDMLRAMREKGLEIAVLSNKPDFAVKAIVSDFFGDLISVAHGGREGVPLKPSPEPLFALISELGVFPDEVAYIGDSEVDVHTGIAADLPHSIAVNWGFRTTDQLVDAGARLIFNTPDKVLEYVLWGASH